MSPDTLGNPPDGNRNPDEATANPQAPPDTDAPRPPASRPPAPQAPARHHAARHRALRLAAYAAVLAAALLATSIALGTRGAGGQAAGSAPVDGAPGDALALPATGPATNSPIGSAPGSLPASPTASLDTYINALQSHLRDRPEDFSSWASLGLGYVEQARSTADPSRYPQAQQALRRSARLRPGNDAALAGLAALAAARHDFTGALRYADRALAVNPYSERALCSRIDALVELGRYTEAAKSADQADARRPGIPVFTRYAYVHELRGDVATAHRVLDRALVSASSPGDVAYVATALGQLAWDQGDQRAALAHYAHALRADPGYVPALQGRARALDAKGERGQAIHTMEKVVARQPLPGPLVELGELYEARGAAGDRARARQQYALVGTWISLARAGGVDVDLDTALAAADHGDRTAALNAARAEWARRHTVHTADALAWALHVNGRDQEALRHARQAAATGYRNATFRYHLGMIEYATGHTAVARRSLAAALALNPAFSPLGARTAHRTLEAAKRTLEAAR